MATKYKLSPSKADRYLQCSASLMYDEEFVESPASIRGSILHDYAEKLLRGKDTHAIVLDNALNDYEMGNINAYTIDVYREADLLDSDRIIVEEKVSVNMYGNKINMILDVLVLGETVASITDLKTGRGIVEVENNSQLFFYAFYVVMKYPRIERVRIAIFQNFKAKRIEVTKDEVLDFFMGKDTKFFEINNDDLQYSPSDKACQWCAHRKVCKARAEWIIGGKK